MIRNILLAVAAFVLGGVAFFETDSLVLSVAVIGIVCYILGILFIALGIKDYIFKVRINKLPEEALCKHYKKLLIFNEKEITINIKDIQEIKSRRYIKTSFGLVHYISREGVLKIRTNNKTYKVENVNNVKEIHKLLNDWIKIDS